MPCATGRWRSGRQEKPTRGSRRSTGCARKRSPRPRADDRVSDVGTGGTRAAHRRRRRARPGGRRAGDRAGRDPRGRRRAGARVAANLVRPPSRRRVRGSGGRGTPRARARSRSAGQPRGGSRRRRTLQQPAHGPTPVETAVGTCRELLGRRNDVGPSRRTSRASWRASEAMRGERRRGARGVSAGRGDVGGAGSRARPRGAHADRRAPRAPRR